MESEEITRLPAALIQGLGGIPTPTLSDALDRLGLAGVLGGIRPVVSGLRCAGTAFTVAEVTAELGAYTSEEFQRERMLDLTEPGDVLVIDNSGRPISSWGGTITFAAKNHGLAGLVVDGAVRDYEAHIYVGTSSWVLCHVPFKKTDIFHAIASLPSSIPGRYFTANEQDMAGGCLDFLIKVLYPEALGQRPPEDVYARLDALAAATPAGADGLMFLPWLNGEKTPVDDETLRGGFYNMGLNHGAPQMVRAVYEGVALNTRWVLTYLERFVGRRLDPLNIIGGGARSEVWCQVFADVLGRTIRQVQDPLQANARGAAFIASVALGEITFDQVPDLVAIANTFEPDDHNAPVYDGMFAELEKIYRANHGIHRRLQELFED